MNETENRRLISILREKQFEAEYFKTKTTPNWFEIIRIWKSIFLSVFEIVHFNFIIIEITIKTEDFIMLSMLHFQEILFHFYWLDNYIQKKFEKYFYEFEKCRNAYLYNRNNYLIPNYSPSIRVTTILLKIDSVRSGETFHFKIIK